MKTKRKFIRSISDARIKRTSWILRILILILIGLVAYDAWQYQTPLYYVLFAVLGALIGRLYTYAYAVNQDSQTGLLTLTNNIIGIVLSLVLILFKLFFAKKTLESMDVHLVKDGIYLFFIGLHWSKLSVISSQLEVAAVSLFRKKSKPPAHPE